jgi:tetratricopeptide (TPR) repeat protein
MLDRLGGPSLSSKLPPSGDAEPRTIPGKGFERDLGRPGRTVSVRSDLSIAEERYGRTLGGWVLEEKIGAGGLAEVWRATKDSRTVALKVLRDREDSHAHRSRFLREGRLLLRLDHPGLPRCYEVHDGESPYLALELLEGETLANRIRRLGRLPPEQVTVVADFLLRILAHLHERGIVHRDVKSSNVFLADDRRVMLFDLGLSADPTDPLTTTLGDVMGTYAYMAPEQIAGAEVDHRSDLYSLGVTLYEALAGERPFRGRGAAEFLQAHREGKAQRLAERIPDAPARLVDAIEQLMARDPVARPSSATIGLAHLTGAGGVKRSLGQAPLVGREAARGAIEALLDNGGVCTLLGEIGSGSGRLGRHALHEARKRSWETIAVRCRGRVPALDPIHQLVRDLTRISGAPAPGIGAIGQALNAQAEEGPLLLVIEDAENLQREASDALDRIMAAAPALRVLVTGVRSPLLRVGHLVRLRPLTREEVRAMVCGMLGSNDPPPGLSTSLHRLGGGMPAIVVLAIKELVQRGALWCEGLSDEGESVWRLDPNVPLAPTVGLGRLFGDVLQALPAEGRAMLDVLAVAGEALPVEVLADVARVEDSTPFLGSLAGAGWVDRDTHVDGEWVGLRRPAVGDLLLDVMPQERQAEIHRDLARSIGRMPREPWRDERSTWHAAHGAGPEDASRALLALGEELHQRGQHARALSVLSRASRSAGIEPRVAAALAIVRGEVLETTGRREEAATALKAGQKLAEDLALSLPDVSRALRSRALASLASVYHGLGDESRAAVLADEALATIGEATDDPALPRVLLVAASGHWSGGRSRIAAELYNRCIDVAISQGRREFEAQAHGGLGWLLAEAGRLDDAARHLEREAAFLRVRTMSQKLVHTLYRLAATRRRAGEAALALEHLDEAVEVARYSDLPFEWALARLGRAAVYMWVGDLERANTFLRSASGALAPEASAFIRLAYRDVQAELRMLAGDVQGALAAYQQAEAEAAKGGFAARGAFHLGMIGVLTANADALTEAMRHLSHGGDRRLVARLLLYGGTVGADPVILTRAIAEARESGDKLLLVEALFASGTDIDRDEALPLAQFIDGHLPRDLRKHFRALPAVRWAGINKADELTLPP